MKTPYELWTGHKPSLKHLHIWGCPAEAMPYKPNERKLDSKIVSSYFVGYPERSRGYKFYDPTTKLIFETGNTQFFEDVEFAKGDKIRDFVFEEEYVVIPPITIDNDQDQVTLPDIVQDVIPDQDNINLSPIQNNEIILEEQTQHTQEHLPLRRSTRERRNTISDDYITFLQEHEVDIGIVEDDPINFHQVIESSNSQKWIDVMNDEIKSMKDNDVWDLVPLPEGKKPSGCK